jgi:ABC-2 type transport system ATP-binding protein
MPLRLPHVRVTRRRLIAGSVVVAVLVGLIGWAVWPASQPFATTAQIITVRSGPSGNEPVSLDTTLFLPDQASAQDPVPAILLAHGFGGSKQSVVSDAEDFAARGYAVLTWTARGFGRSGGQIHLDSPDYEVRDAQRLIDWLAARPDIAKNADGDPKVAAVGGSYGGALSLMLASQDNRVDAIVPMITWNDLSRAFLPNGTGQQPAEGVFKKQWAGLFFGSGSGGDGGLLGGLGTSGVTGPGTGGGDTAGGSDPGSGGGPPSTPGPAAPTSGVPTPRVAVPDATASPGAIEGLDGAGLGALAKVDPACGRFASDVCAAYLDVATNGAASPSTIDLLRRSSPAPGLSRIKAPTLLIQGQADSLFPLSEAEANYRAIAATGTPVRMDWFTGGHDGGQGPQSDRDRLKYLTITWLDYYLMGKGDKPSTGFTFSRVSGFDAESRRLTTSGFSSDTYPDTAAEAPVSVPIAGPPQRIANPPDGNPAAITVLPGTGSGGLSGLLSGVSLEIPGQHADFYSEPLANNTDVVGLPTVQLQAAAPTGEAVLFIKLYDFDPQAGSSLPFGLTAPVRLTGLPTTINQAQPVTVTLPGIVYRFEAGHRLRVTVSTSDQAYTTPVQPAVYTIALPATGTAVVLPQLTGSPIANPEVIWRYVLVGVVVFIALGIVAALVVARMRRRRRMVSVVEEFVDTPLVVRGLRKEYADGFVAVSTVDFTVQRGQVVGLLGPNGAGKTTSLRVLLGMTQPTKGEILVFGHHLKPGADVLTRLGALVEGPGFLPHVTGLANLHLYWRSTGRPMSEARFDEALDIAGLGDAVHRKVRKYSHGMKQRLAIAQAMLGLPELLVLDEPTDGLDPPQIAEMRKVLRAYATNGRAVLVSSHLLAEVEQTCTHVVVMNKGEVVADGPVEDVVGDSPIAQFEVSDVEAASTVLDGMSGIRSVTPDGRTSLIVDLNGTARTDVVAALVGAGVGVDRVVPRRRLEDAFLTLVGGDSKASGER